MTSSNFILLVETGIDPETRICMEYNSLKECMDGICGFYEVYLSILNPTASIITYEINQLFDFLDNLVHISCLVYQPDTMTYYQFDKHWIKVELFIEVAIQANQRQ
ncbi:protein enhancer of rudimentary-like [Aphis craccivora]|uniref:Protein enhancer of rudimentary-like n=1 Tax=Aphis craccivora TaxID=307492 RepID=A0A6G0YKJ0_APHCR|nr:protein enhancer of rudimentary-like [Aphis craccivora]